MRIALIFCVVTAFSGKILAQQDTAHHRALYKEINEAAEAMDTAEAKARDEEREVTLKAWLEGGNVRKILASDAGGTISEYYLEEEEPVFVFNVSPDAAGGKVEERLYFRDGVVFKWLTTEKDAPVFHAEDYQATTELHLRLTALYLDALGKGAAAGNSLEGRFLGLEEGDFTHWRMSDGDDRERSFFLLRTTPEMEKTLEDPEAFKGKRCRIRWKTSEEELEEAGGKTELDMLLSVEWLE